MGESYSGDSDTWAITNSKAARYLRWLDGAETGQIAHQMGRLVRESTVLAIPQRYSRSSEVLVKMRAIYAALRVPLSDSTPRDPGGKSAIGITA
jgi:hypothetical protein